ncbi:MAG: acetyl-CoA carboxylase biotin carboxylase subunit family protein [Proteobacteria bacterium]|nr:acetyl-CoA carboxylase biotin carboxylase subunit family protein [Pseudomonadota bacterium]
MYRRILIANRADCAVRLIRACHEEGIEAYVITSRDEQARLAHALADGVICTGASMDAYLAEDDILEAARLHGCEAILPGWGFLSEDALFARRCRLAHIDFIGPGEGHLWAFGDKLETVRLLSDTRQHGVMTAEEALADLGSVPMPCMLKGRFGGGGKQVTRMTERESLGVRLSALRDMSRLRDYYVEPYIDGRHIEYQVMGDGCGHVHVLGARDCTWQNGHQKYMELSYEDADQAALRAARDGVCVRLSELGYRGYGTVEFIVDRDGGAHLLELNPRLQVEHGVTEMTSGIDIVRTAIRLAWSGRYEPVAVPANVEEAIEFRLFARGTGRIGRIGFDGYDWPGYPQPEDALGRVETGYACGAEISGVYDGMIARFILGAPLGKARACMQKWLSGFVVEGGRHNLNDLYDQP